MRKFTRQQRLATLLCEAVKIHILGIKSFCIHPVSQCHDLSYHFRITPHCSTLPFFIDSRVDADRFIQIHACAKMLKIGNVVDRIKDLTFFQQKSPKNNSLLQKAVNRL